MSDKSVRIYSVTLHDETGTGTTETTVSARSRSGAKYSRWLDIADCFADWTFGDFLKHFRPGARRSPSRRSYDYIREHYHIDVKPGQEVREGIVAEPNQSHQSYVYIFKPGASAATPHHPSEVHP